MDFFISNAYAQAASQTSPYSFPLMMVFLFGAFYFLLIRPQQKKQKAHEKLISEVSIGSEVLTGGGILGRVTGASELYAIVQIAEETEIKILKSSISQIVPKGTFEEA